MSEVAPPIEGLLREIKLRKLRVNSWWHCNSGWWQANLRSDDGRKFYDFGIGPDAAGALEGALEKFYTGRQVAPLHPTDHDRLPGALPAPEVAPDIEDLL